MTGPAAAFVASLLPLAAAPPGLEDAPSPFLRERAADPVRWRPWGEAAFEQARADERPVLLVIGRAPSDRCRRGLAEVLAQPAIVEAVEGRFAPVLADRDERPDLAEAATLALALLGKAESGLPLFLVLTPDARPVAGTSVAGPGGAFRLRPLLSRAAEDWAERRGEVLAHSGVTALSLRDAQAGEPGPLVRDAVDHALRGLGEAFDAKRGGFGTAPKAIPHGALRLLLAQTGPEARRMAEATLEAMARGAIRDAQTGAFHDEALDDGWRVAVSGSSLADNALLLRAYVLAHDTTGRALFREAALGIAGWLLGPMRAGEGGFAAATWRGPSGEAARDARVFAGGNGLAVSALALSGRLLDRPGDLAAARSAAEAVLARLGPPGSLRRFALGPQAFGSALLEDHAYLAEGLLDLAEATGDDRWRDGARALADAALLRFADPGGGGFYDTDAAHAPVLVRTRSGFDGVHPSANAVLASVLRRLGAATGETRYAERGRRTVEAFAGGILRVPRGMETMALAVGDLLAPAPLPEAALAARETRGPVTVELLAVPSRVAPGSALLGRVRLVVAAGWSVNAHRPGPRDLAALTVSVPEDGLAVGPPRYPEPESRTRRFSAQPVAVHTGEVTVTVPIRVPEAARPGPRPLRVRVGFQACRAEECEAPESVVLEAAVQVGR